MSVAIKATQAREPVRRVYSYVRWSTPEQGDGDSLSRAVPVSSGRPDSGGLAGTPLSARELTSGPQLCRISALICKRHTDVVASSFPPPVPPRFTHGGATGGTGMGHGVESRGSAVARRGSAQFRCSAKDHGRCRLSLRERSCMPLDALIAGKKLTALAGERSSTRVDSWLLGAARGLGDRGDALTGASSLGSGGCFEGGKARGCV